MGSMGAVESEPRCLVNVARALATSGHEGLSFLTEISLARVDKVTSEVGNSISEGLDENLGALITNLKALAWALHFREQLTVELDATIHDAIMTMARARDSLVRAEPCISRGSLPEDDRVGPCIVLDLPDLCVVHKPVDWEVDFADVGSGFWLSSFLQQQFTFQRAPLVHLEEHQFGMVHRLDRVSSGLLLVGKTFTGFHCLGWQLNTGRLDREYVVLVHGWVPPELRFVDERVLHVHAEGQKESSVGEQGKPSQTLLTTLGHYHHRAHHDCLSLVVIQICTGRRHQIRTHLAHVGHPTVADGKYTNRETFVRDRQWCQRNFLHRYRLGFQDVQGRSKEAVASLPADLVEALQHLVPVDGPSETALAEWTDGDPKPWSSYVGLIH